MPTHKALSWGSPYGLVVNLIDYVIEVSEFEIQSYNYVHFWMNTFGKRIKLFIPSARD